MEKCYNEGNKTHIACFHHFTKNEVLSERFLQYVVHTARF